MWHLLRIVVVDPGGDLSNSMKNLLGHVPTFFFPPHVVGYSATGTFLIMQ